MSGRTRELSLRFEISRANNFSTSRCHPILSNLPARVPPYLLRNVHKFSWCNSISQHNISRYNVTINSYTIAECMQKTRTSQAFEMLHSMVPPYSVDCYQSDWHMCNSSCSTILLLTVVTHFFNRHWHGLGEALLMVNQYLHDTTDDTD